VFVHADHCVAHAGSGFPQALRALPLLFEAHASEGRTTVVAARPDLPAEALVESLFAGDAEWLQMRHAEAGCFIATIDRC
jgi:hypothetical protein